MFPNTHLSIIIYNYKKKHLLVNEFFLNKSEKLVEAAATTVLRSLPPQ